MRNLLLLYWLCLVSFCASQSNNGSDTEWPLHDDGYTTRLQWDHYSLLIDGERTFVWSGEFHPWRVPVPEVWQDLLEKIKAAGFNTVSIYLHWAFHAPNPDTIDMETGARNIDLLLEMAKDVGLFVTFRNGPYVNAETTAGGFALWLTTGAYGALRDNDPRYQAAWEPFMTASNQVSAKHDFDNGGPIVLQQIENEIGGQRKSDGEIDHTVADYMEALAENGREQDITIPFFTNAPNMRTKSWSKDYLPGTGAQDMYGVDSYPACWSCNLTECGTVREFTTVDYFPHFNEVSPTQPSFIPEFQGGSYNPWGGPEGGCGGPGTLLDAEFVNVFYRDLVAQRITLVSLYMLYGGTNWGGLATNVVATSYDYSAPIRETREIQDKYSETKLFGLFLRTANDHLTKTDRPHNLTAAITDVSTVGATELRNPDTKAAFYVVRHVDSADLNTDNVKLQITTKDGANLTVPQYADPIRLEGRQSKIIVSDFTFGENTLLYSTAELLSHAIVDGQSVLVLWTPDGEAGEFAISGGSRRKDVLSGFSSDSASFNDAGGDLVVSWKAQDASQLSVLQFDKFRVIVLSRTLAYRFWAPALTQNPRLKPQDIGLVTGPYLVRTLAFEHGTAVLTGDVDDSTTVEVWAPSNVRSISWNGKRVDTKKTSYGALRADLAKPQLSKDALQSSLKLEGWKYSDALPESGAEYDDSNWVVADKTTSPNPRNLTTPVSLYADDYGYHNGVQVFRGRFSGQEASGVQLEVQGGTASGFSAWVNDIYLGSFPGLSTADAGTLNLTFANASLSDGENVLTVVMDHSGHNQRAEAVFPRGILNYQLQTTSGSNVSFSEWRIAGNAGGESNIDPVRGPLNEGGLHAERLGWHLPGFDDGDWEEKKLSQGVEGGRIGFFRTISELDVPKGLDASLEFVLTAPEGSNLRAQLYVNGYQYGKFVPQVGNQIAFPVPPGILNYRGSNTIGLNVWSQSNDTATVDVKWNVLGVWESSFGDFDGEYLQPEWTEERLEYA